MTQPRTAWSNNDPRYDLVDLKDATIVILRPGANNRWEAGMGDVAMKHGWFVHTSFANCPSVGDTWDPMWFWTLAATRHSDCVRNCETIKRDEQPEEELSRIRPVYDAALNWRKNITHCSDLPTQKLIEAISDSIDDPKELDDLRKASWRKE